jgi:acyl carrier protein
MSLESDLRALVADHAIVSADDSAPIELDSLTLVTIVEALEDEFGIRVQARDVVPSNFATLAAIVAFVRARQA